MKDIIIMWLRQKQTKINAGNIIGYNNWLDHATNPYHVWTCDQNYKMHRYLPLMNALIWSGLINLEWLASVMNDL